MLERAVNLMGKFFPAHLALRYLVVGAFNTLFGTLIYWACVWLCEDIGRFGYMVAAVMSNILAVSESFLSYKLLVFKTKGRWLPEYLKCWMVYGGASLINLALLPLCVEATRYFLSEDYSRLAPYVGGLLLTGVTVVISFLGHKNITFRRA